MPNITRSDMRQLKSKILIETILSGEHHLYLGVNGAAAWPNEYDPPQPKDTSAELHQFWDHLVGFQKIPQKAAWSAIRHSKWYPGRTFEVRNPNEDMDLQVRHYCVNKNFEVYQCIVAEVSNLEYPRATTEPIGHNFGKTINTGDGYQWKYLYQLTPYDMEHRVSDDFIPVYIRPSEFTEDQKRYGVTALDNILNVRHVVCRMHLVKHADWAADAYRQIGLFIDIRNSSDLELATADYLLPSEVLSKSGYLVYTENIKKTIFIPSITDVIDIAIEC